MKTKNETKIKCVVWDLDNTIWNGVLLEEKEVSLRDGIVDIIKEFDARGILQSIASRNEYIAASKKLEEFGISKYFLYPQINWNSKAVSVKKIAENINIGLDTLAFIDDQAFERDEVNFVHPSVVTIDAMDMSHILDRPEMNPRFITEDSKKRREMYKSDIERKKVEENFSESQEEFLALLDMKLTISPVKENDLQRVEELTIRTHQLNTTGYTYSYEELEAMLQSKDYKLFIAGLEDKYGTYGKIGIVLIECSNDVWTIKLLLMSCRVMSRGIGSVLINYIMKLAKENNIKLRAEFVKTNHNRMMYITYKFSGFKEIKEDGDTVIFENDLELIQDFPKHIKIDILENIDK